MKKLIKKVFLNPTECGEKFFKFLWTNIPQKYEINRLVLTAPIDTYKGYREWFTIQTMVFSVPVKEVQSKKARMPKIYVFKVIPYKVHASLWMKPSDNPPGVKNIIREARKEYNYIYTGKNKDIINFDIKYDYRFFTPVPKDKGAVAEHNFAGESSTDKTKDGKKLVEGDGTEKETKFPMKQVGASDVQPIVSGMAAVGGDEKDKIARDFHNALINSNVDLVNVITIMATLGS